MVLSDGHGTPLAVLTETASRHEVKLIEPLIKRVRIPRRGRGRPKKRVKRLIDDKAADSDPFPKSEVGGSLFVTADTVTACVILVISVRSGLCLSGSPLNCIMSFLASTPYKNAIEFTLYKNRQST